MKIAIFAACCILKRKSTIAEGVNCESFYQYQKGVLGSTMSNRNQKTSPFGTMLPAKRGESDIGRGWNRWEKGLEGV